MIGAIESDVCWSDVSSRTTKTVRWWNI